MKIDLSNGTLKQTAYFSGVTIFAFLVALLLHELGHAFAIYVTGQEIARISFHPFTGAVTRYTTVAGDPATARFIAAGGVMFGSLFSLLVSAPFIFRFRNSWTAPFSMVAVASLAGNGLMLVIGSTLDRVGDVIKLLSLGVSRVLLLSSGFFLLFLAAYVFCMISPGLGFGPDVGFRKRCVILGGALGPYLICVLGYNAFFQSDRLGLYLIYTVAGSAFALAGVYICGYWQTRFALVKVRKPDPIQWIHFLYACCLVLSFLCVLNLLGSIGSVTATEHRRGSAGACPFRRFARNQQPVTSCWRPVIFCNLPSNPL